jgi:hypothetical protein
MWTAGAKEAWLAECAKWDELRHRCEVRACLRMRWETQSRDGVDRYLELAAAKRTPEAVERLRRDIVQQWTRKNRGVGMDWRDE